MPKEKKKLTARALLASGSSGRHAPLGQILEIEEHEKKYATVKARRRYMAHHNNEDKEEDEEEFLDERTSKRILQLGQEQRMEVLREEKEEKENEIKKNMKKHQKKQSVKDENDDDDDDDDASISMNIHDDDDEDADEDNIVELVQQDDGEYVTVVEGASGLSEEEEAIVASMMGSNTEQRRTLADIILEKIQEKEEKQQQQLNENIDSTNLGEPTLPPKVIEVYTDIGKILSRYTAGKLPKAFKVIPSLSNWEEVLYLTRPDLWTPQAMYAATRIFASNLNPKMAQRFYNLVLLDSVRADIFENKRLNYHYYMSLKKAVYKPAAFFKGILLPLCSSTNNSNFCTLREAAIIASVLQRVSIPMHHAAVAIHKLAQIPTYGGATSIFLRTLLNKKYSLPAPVIHSLVQHFASFAQSSSNNNNNNNLKTTTKTTTTTTTTTMTLPVLWHQALLTFVQRYGNEIRKSLKYKESLRLVMKYHYHAKITPEIRRELFGLQAFKDERNNNSNGNNTGNEVMGGIVLNDERNGNNDEMDLA